MAEGAVRLIVVTLVSIVISTSISYFVVFDQSEKRIVNTWVSNFFSKMKKIKNKNWVLV